MKTGFEIRLPLEERRISDLFLKVGKACSGIKIFFRKKLNKHGMSQNITNCFQYEGNIDIRGGGKSLPNLLGRIFFTLKNSK